MHLKLFIVVTHITLLNLFRTKTSVCFCLSVIERDNNVTNTTNTYMYNVPILSNILQNENDDSYVRIYFVRTTVSKYDVDINNMRQRLDPSVM